MRGPRTQEKKVEANFFFSFFFLIFSLIVSFAVYLNFNTAPSFSVHVAETTKRVEIKKEVLTKKPVQKKEVQEKSLEPSLPQNIRPKFEESLASIPEKTPQYSEDEIRNFLKESMRHVTKGNTPKAKELLEKILKSNPEHEGALTHLAQIYQFDLDDSESAEPLYKKILELNPDNIIAVAGMVDIYSERIDLDGAERLQDLYEQHQTNDLALEVGWSLMNSADPRKAVPYLEIAGAEAYDDLIEVHRDLGNHEQVLNVLQKKEKHLRQRAEEGYNTQDSLVEVEMQIAETYRSLGFQDLANKKLRESSAYRNQNQYSSQADQPYNRGG